MHDPQTVAHEIRSPIKRRSEFFKDGYRSPLITIWHVDPEDHTNKCGVRDDDSCGWSSPPYTPAERDRIKKLGVAQYGNIFEKQARVAEGAEYADLCYEPSAYDAIYWAWRAIKYSQRKYGWMYGESRPALTVGELEQIYTLSANPVDNLRWRVADVKDKETCAIFFLNVYRCYLRYHRPWYKHPKWHVHHWKLQIHPWQTFRRWLLSRCAKCGKGFHYGESPVSIGWHSKPIRWFRGEEDVYHSDCSGYGGPDREKKEGE